MDFQVSSVYFYGVISYLMVLVGVAVYLSKRVHSQADFAVAGRSLPSFVVFGTLVATWMGSGSLFGHSEKAYSAGLVITLMLLADVLGFGLLYMLAGKVRRMQQLTLQDLLETRYNKWVRLFGSIALIIAYTTIVSYQFRAAGSVLNLIKPSISVGNATIMAAGFIILFTVTAGLLSVAYTDVIQGVTMIVGVFIALPILISKAGGMGEIVNQLPSSYFNPFHDFSFTAFLGLFLPAFLLLLGDANMYQRFFAARSEGSAKKAVSFVIVGILAVELAIIFMAMIGQVLEPDLANPGKVIAVLAIKHVPMILGVVMITVIAAVVVSTGDSYLLSPATSFARDIYQSFLRPKASEKEMLLVSRASVIVLGLIALGLTQLSDQFLAVALYAYTIYGASITPALMAALFWKRATTAGALGSIIGGTATTLLWELVDHSFQVDAVIPAITVSLTLLIVLSLATPKQGVEKLKPFGLES
ncbi:sodium:solute symporter family protein [bacterium]|nr:sodium:solute symporter family protein [bacterium]